MSSLFRQLAGKRPDQRVARRTHTHTTTAKNTGSLTWCETLHWLIVSWILGMPWGTNQGEGVVLSKLTELNCPHNSRWEKGWLAENILSPCSSLSAERVWLKTKKWFTARRRRHSLGGIFFFLQAEDNLSAASLKVSPYLALLLYVYVLDRAVARDMMTVMEGEQEKRSSGRSGGYLSFSKKDVGDDVREAAAQH